MHYSRSYLLEKPKRPVRRRRKKIAALAALMVLILAVLFSVNLIGVFHSIQNRDEWARSLRLQKGGDEQVYLLCGIDLEGAKPYVERLLMVHHDLAGKTVSLLHLPGNTMVETEAGARQPLGRLYHELGEAAFVATVQELTGIAVHHYAALRYQGLAVLGDHLGGLKSVEMGGEEGANALLPAGEARLSGFELYRYFTTAGYQEPPWDQLVRQQGVLAALWNRMEQRKFWQWPRMIRLLSPYLETDLSWRELTVLSRQFSEYSFDEMRQLTLPGSEKVIEGALLWVPDEGSLKDILSLLNEGYLVTPSEVRVEVLNGSGIDGLAAEVASLLDQEGFNVVRTGNADRFDYPSTQVIALGEVVDKARAAALHIPGASMLHQHDPEARIDVRVIIGSNYRVSK